MLEHTCGCSFCNSVMNLGIALSSTGSKNSPIFSCNTSEHTWSLERVLVVAVVISLMLAALILLFQEIREGISKADTKYLLSTILRLSVLSGNDLVMAEKILLAAFVG